MCVSCALSPQCYSQLYREKLKSSGKTAFCGATATISLSTMPPSEFQRHGVSKSLISLSSPNKVTITLEQFQWQFSVHYQCNYTEALCKRSLSLQLLDQLVILLTSLEAFYLRVSYNSFVQLHRKTYTTLWGCLLLYGLLEYKLAL